MNNEEVSNVTGCKSMQYLTSSTGYLVLYSASSNEPMEGCERRVTWDRGLANSRAVEGSQRHPIYSGG